MKIESSKRKIVHPDTMITSTTLMKASLLSPKATNKGKTKASLNLSHMLQTRKAKLKALARASGPLTE